MGNIQSSSACTWRFQNLLQQLEAGREAHVGGARAEQVQRGEAEQRVVLEGLPQPGLLAADARGERGVEHGLLDARVGLDGPHELRDQRGAAARGLGRGDGGEELAQITVLLLQQVQCVHSDPLPCPRGGPVSTGGAALVSSACTPGCKPQNRWQGSGRRRGDTR
ncbi:MAG: hypothetical protein QM820_31515 [Minicystis sp.]